MAVRDLDKEKLLDRYFRITGFRKPEARRDNFLWCYLNLSLNYSFEPYPHAEQLFTDITSHPLNNDGKSVFKEDILHNLVELEELSWVLDSQRQLNWIRQTISLELKKSLRSDELNPDRILSGSTPKSLAILIIDLLDIERNEKVNLIRNLKDQWKRASLPIKEAKWFDKETEGKIVCLNDIVSKENLIGRPTITNREDIEILYDNLSIWGNHLQFQDIIRRTKTRYQKSTFNERNSEKKQCNILLPKRLIDKLDKQAAKQGKSRSELVLDLLNEAMNKTG